MTTPRFPGCQSRSGEINQRRIDHAEILQQSNINLKQPSHVAYHIRDNKNGKAFWTRVGTAWQHADGKGFNIQIDTVPLDGRVGLRTITEKAD